MTDQLTLQDVFDNAVRGIYKQGGPAYDMVSSACCYRLPMPDGSIRKCGIGQSIPDDIWSEDLEGMGIMRILESTFDIYQDAADLFDRLDADALDRIQTIHDRAARQDSYEDSHPDSAPFMETFLSDSLVFSYQHDLTWPSDVPRPD